MKRRRSLTVIVPLTLAAAVLFVVLGGGSAFGANGAGAGNRDDEGQGCSNATAKGGYAYHVTGVVVSPTGAEVAKIAAVGLVVLDGRGHGAGHDWASQNGVTTPRTLTATYTVDPDCTGMVHVVFTPGGAVNAFFVLAEGGRVMKIIQTDTGAVVSGDAVRQ